jgi:DNA-binding GntR family transcriptional regulator
MRTLDVLTTVEAVEKDLERRIFAGEFMPGERLTELQLSTEYGVARNSVRTAIDALVKRRLLSKEPNRGVSLPTLAEDDVRSIFQVREFIEVPACRAAAEARTVPQESRAALRRFERMTPRTPQRDLLECDIAFHAAIVDLLGNERISNVYRSVRLEDLLFRSYRPVRWTNPPATTDAHHKALLDEIGAGAPDAAERVIREHLESSRKSLLAVAHDAAATELVPDGEPI